jgi:hypothetical protein
MTADGVATRREHTEAAHQFSQAKNQDRSQCDLMPAPFWSVAKVLHWAGYGTSGLCLLLVMTGGGGLLEISAGAAAAFVGAAAGALAERLGPNRLLRGIRVKEVLTPTCLTVPYYTRLGDLIAKHSVTSRCCFVVARDGHVLGVLNGGDLTSVELRRHSDDTVEWHMHPVDWIEAVDIADDAAEALDWMKRYRRTSLPVLHGNRLIGMVTKERIVEAAFHRL